MKKPVLILRTVSVEKMAPVLEACSKRWPQREIWVLSSSNRCEEIRQDQRVSKVLAYDGGTGGFLRPIKLDTRVEAVVVPVANEGGSGYGNVMRAALGVSACEYAICSRCRDIVEFGEGGFFWRSCLERLVGGLARLFSGYWAERLLEDVGRGK